MRIGKLASARLDLRQASLEPQYGIPISLDDPETVLDGMRLEWYPCDVGARCVPDEYSTVTRTLMAVVEGLKMRHGASAMEH